MSRKERKPRRGTTEARIEYRETPSSERELWAIRVDTWAQIRESAQDLLRDLREGHKRALVWVNGRRVQLPKGN